MAISPFTSPKISLWPQADGPVEVPGESFSNVKALMDMDSKSTAPAPGDANSKGAEVGIPTESIYPPLLILHDNKQILELLNMDLPEQEPFPKIYGKHPAEVHQAPEPGEGFTG